MMLNMEKPKHCTKQLLEVTNQCSKAARHIKASNRFYMLMMNSLTDILRERKYIQDSHKEATQIFRNKFS